MSVPSAAIWNGSTSFASVTLFSGGGVKVSRKARRDVEEISTWDGERPTGSVVVAARSCVRTPFCPNVEDRDGGSDRAGLALDFISAIDDVEPAVGNCKAYRLRAPGTDGRMMDEFKRAVAMDAEHRNGIASLVDCEEETSVRTGDDFLVGIVGSEQPLRIGYARTTGFERSDLRELTVGVLPVCNHGVLAGIGIVCFRVNKTCGLLQQVGRPT